MVSQLIIVLPSLIYLLINRINYKEAVRLKKIRPSTALLMIVFTFLVLPVMNFVNALSQLYATDTTSGTMMSITGKTPFLVSLIVIALVPCVFEESVYRGIFYNEYSKHNKIGAVLLSAFLFGILHGNLNQFTYAFAMGIVFAFVIEATDSIVSTMIMHFIINGNSVVLLYLYPKMMEYLESSYRAAEQRGDTAVLQMIESFVGGTNFSAEDMLANASETVGSLTIIDVFATYGIQALIFGLLAFFLYKRIAKNENRLDKVKEMFSRNENSSYTVNSYGWTDQNTFTDSIDAAVVNPAQTGRKNVRGLFSIPLYIAIGICIISMVFYELIVSGIIKM